MSRLKEVRTYLGLTQKELAESIGQKWYKIKDIETEKNKISIEIADQIRENYSISFDWLLTGKGTMLLSDEKATSQISNNNAKQSSSNLVEITYYEDVYASAGGGAYNYDLSPAIMAFDENFLKIHLGLTSFKNIHIITSTGDSMEPTIASGEFLFISPIENEGGMFNEGGIYIILCEDTVLVKRVSKDPISKEVLLISDNTLYPSRTLKYKDFDNCKIIGRVIGHFKGL